MRFGATPSLAVLAENRSLRSARLNECFGLRAAPHTPIPPGCRLAPRRVGRKNREAYAWIIEHPLGAIGLEHGRRAGEHSRIKTDGRGKVMDREIYLLGVHADVLTLRANTPVGSEDFEASTDRANASRGYRNARGAPQDRQAGA